MVEKEKNFSKHVHDIKAAFDDALQDESWDQSLFLRGIRKKLQEIYDEFKQAIQPSDTSNTKTGFRQAAKTAEDRIKVYISLYNGNGNSVRQWEQLLHNIAHQVINRPVLKTEKDVRELIRSKAIKQNEGYVEVEIPKTSIIAPPGGVPLHDSFGHELLSIKEGSVIPKTIIRFVHSSGVYMFMDNKLILQQG